MGRERLEQAENDSPMECKKVDCDLDVLCCLIKSCEISSEIAYA